MVRSLIVGEESGSLGDGVAGLDRAVHEIAGAGQEERGAICVSNDVAPGQEVLGIPAIPLNEARRAMMTFSRLPQMRTALRRLTREVAALKKQLDKACPEHDQEGA